MDTERPPKSYLGRFGAAFAILGSIVGLGMLTLIVLWVLALTGHLGDWH
jgi:hypothetical protein